MTCWVTESHVQIYFSGEWRCSVHNHWRYFLVLATAHLFFMSHIQLYCDHLQDWECHAGPECTFSRQETWSWIVSFTKWIWFVPFVCVFVLCNCSVGSMSIWTFQINEIVMFPSHAEMGCNVSQEWNHSVPIPCQLGLQPLACGSLLVCTIYRCNCLLVQGERDLFLSRIWLSLAPPQQSTHGSPRESSCVNSRTEMKHRKLNRAFL